MEPEYKNMFTVSADDNGFNITLHDDDWVTRLKPLVVKWGACELRHRMRSVLMSVIEMADQAVVTRYSKGIVKD